MNTRITNFISVSDKLKSLGLAPTNGLTLIPDNFDIAVGVTDLRQQAEADTVRTLFRLNNLPLVELFNKAQQPPYIQNNGYEWFGPTLFLPVAFLSQNPHIISVALGLITNHLYDIFRGSGNGSASLQIVCESKDGTCTKISYSGTIDGLKEIPNIVASLDN